MSKLNVEIRSFRSGDETAFRELNEVWIRELFALETKDLEILYDPRTYILERGGQIVMAAAGEQRLGCCALIPKGPNGFELGKMAVHPAQRGTGIGRRILTYVVEYARSVGADFLYLETSHKLPSAIHLYESVGFTRIPSERIVPSPYARSDIYMEMVL